MAIIAISAILLTGCQDEQLSQCRLENEELQKTIEAQKLELRKTGGAVMNSSQMVSFFVAENEKLMNEIKALKAAQQATPKPQTQKPAQTPEQKEKIRKGLEQLFELQRESAEKMKKEAQK